jgi:hypothetical protein
MFRIMQDPSSQSTKLYLTEVTDNGSIVQVVVHMVSVWRHILTCSVCVCLYTAPGGEVLGTNAIYTHTHYRSEYAAKQ